MEIHKFNMAKVTPGKIILMVGKRNTGKSTLVVDVLKHFRDSVPCAVVVSGSESGNGFYAQYIPKIMIHHEYDEDIIQKTIVRQKKITRRYNAGEKVNPHTLLILDDIAYDKAIYRQKSIREMIYNGRHFNLTVIIAVQYLVDIPADVRTNIDLIFGLRENILSNKERLYKFFYGIFPDFHSFSQAFNACTNDFECLVCDNTSRSNNLSDCVYWYKAPLHPVFRFGHPHYWELAERCYNTEYEDDDDVDLGKTKKYTPKKPAISIKKLDS